LKKCLYIAGGGFAGAILRYWIRSIETDWPGQFPVTTLAVNLLGCFLMGFVMSLAIAKMQVSSEARLGMTTGFLGALTTFATVCRELVVLLQQGMIPAAIIYGVISVLLGLTAVYGGRGLGCRLSVAIRRKSEAYVVIPDESEET
jgi:fluoride exporter